MIADFLSFLNALPDETQPQTAGQDAGLQGQPSKDDEKDLLSELAAMLEGDAKQPATDQQQAQPGDQSANASDSFAPTTPALNLSNPGNLLGALLGLMHAGTNSNITAPATPDRKKSDGASESIGVPVTVAAQPTPPVMPLPLNLSLPVLQAVQHVDNSQSTPLLAQTLTNTQPLGTHTTTTLTTTPPPTVALLANWLGSAVPNATPTQQPAPEQQLDADPSSSSDATASPADATATSADPTVLRFTTAMDIQKMFGLQQENDDPSKAAENLQTPAPVTADVLKLSALPNYQLPPTTTTEVPTSVVPPRNPEPPVTMTPVVPAILPPVTDVTTAPSVAVPQAVTPPQSAPVKSVEPSPNANATPKVAFNAVLTEAATLAPAPQSTDAMPSQPNADAPVKQVHAAAAQPTLTTPQSDDKEQATDPVAAPRPNAVPVAAPVGRDVAAAPAASPRPAPAPAPQDAAAVNNIAPTRFQETQQGKPAALNEISVRVAGPDQSSASIRVVNQGSELHVSVRASDEQLAASLRGDVEHLASRLDASGWNADIWKPVSATATTRVQASAEQTFQDRPGSDNQQQSQDPGGQQQQNNGRQRRPEWAEEYEQWQ